MDDAQLRLDGNAAAGILSEIFAHEMTSARSACGSCGNIAELGAQHLYMNPLSPGAVLRCVTCECVLMVMVHANGRLRVAASGLDWVEVRMPDESPA
jgi:Family of unknown function (DUF6510)